MSSPLVDSDGFPRADIDVASVRTARSKIIHLRNDVRAVSDQIASALELLMARPESTATSSGGAQDAEMADAEQAKAFALVDGVTPGGPAARAGLKRTDRIVHLGPIHAGNHERLSALGPLLQRHEGMTVPLTILRDSADDGAEPTTLVLHLTPQKWSGRGLLGAHIVPL